MSDKDLPEIDLYLKSIPIVAKTKKLGTIKCDISKWMLWMNGISLTAAWLNVETKEHIDVDYDKAVLSAFYTGPQAEKAADELGKLLPDDE
ncbi:hypothetical protein LCGC14_1609050 [marine sediment metagenome]|uniref:Uncharacterized protein n=1 Tax=marine sediment metagenome TaxID=412755 RepID=A0A0F9KPT2_9ZZZZ